MIVTHKLSPMDLISRGVAQRIDVVQDDKYSRNLEIQLTANGLPWTIPNGTKAMIRFKKPDGTGGNYDTMPDGTAAYTISGNVLTVALAPQVCTAPGPVLLAVGLMQGNAEINTFSVHIIVQPNPGVNVVSEDYNHVAGYLKSSGWEPNMFLGTDADGNVVTVWAEGGSGRGIASIGRTAGNGAPGTTDTYTITYTDGTTSQYGVYNGADGRHGERGKTGVGFYAGAQFANGNVRVQIYDWERPPANGDFVMIASSEMESNIGNVYLITNVVTLAEHLYQIETQSQYHIGNLRGPKGENGGTGGFTEAEKAEIVNAVLAALPTWEGGSY